MMTPEEHSNAIETTWRDRERVVAIIRDTARKNGWLSNRESTGYEFLRPVEVGFFAHAVADALNDHHATAR